jgi:hypothetical protein
MYATAWNYGGIGSGINEYGRAFAFALSMGRIFVPTGRWMFAEGGDCPNQVGAAARDLPALHAGAPPWTDVTLSSPALQDWACYFQISPCHSEERQTNATQVAGLGAAHTAPHADDVAYDFGNDWDLVRSRGAAHTPVLALLMDGFNVTMLEAWGAIMDNMLQPQQWFRRQIEHAMLHDFGGTSRQPEVALHIRSGEFHPELDTRSIVPDSVYIAALDQIHTQLNMASVFVATDHPKKGAAHLNEVYANKPYRFFSAPRVLVDEGVMVSDLFRTNPGANNGTREVAQSRVTIGVLSNWRPIVGGLAALRRSDAVYCIIDNDKWNPDFPFLCDGLDALAQPAGGRRAAWHIFKDFHLLGFPHPPYSDPAKGQP